MKNRKLIGANAIVVIDRVTKASELNVITKDFCGDVVITKKLIIDKNLDISCNLHVIEGIARKSPISEYNIKINGDLYCYGEIHCNDINVSGCLYSEYIIYSRNIKVGENLLCDDKIDAYGCDIIVANDIGCYGIVARKVEYLGKISIEGPISITESMISAC